MRLQTYSSKIQNVLKKVILLQPFSMFFLKEITPLPGIQVFKYSGIQKNKRGIPVQIEFLLYI